MAVLTVVFTYFLKIFLYQTSSETGVRLTAKDFAAVERQMKSNPKLSAPQKST